MAEPTITVEIAFGVGALTDPTGGQWVDVSASVRSITTNRGRSTERDASRPGTATVVLDNSARLFDPLHSGGTYFGNLVPRTHIRIVATWSAVEYPIFRGFVEGWPQSWQTNNVDATVTVQCVDALAILATTVLKSPWEYAIEAHSPDAWWRLNETAGQRMNDSSGNGNDGDWKHGAVDSKSGPLIADETTASLKSPGNSDDDGLQPHGRVPGYFLTAGPYTVVSWVKWSAADVRALVETPGNYEKHWICGSLDSTNGYGFRMGIEADADYTPVPFTISAATVVAAGISESKIIFPIGRAIGLADKVHMLALTMSAGDESVLYFDTDSVVGEVPTVGGSIGSPSFIIGGTAALGRDVYADQAWAGEIDDVVVVLGVLTAADIAVLYDAGTAPWIGDKAGERVTRILDLISWPSALYTVTGGQSILNAASVKSKTVLAALQQVERSEQGHLFVDSAGVVTFRSRADIVSETRSTVSQHTFSDNGTSGEQSRILAGRYDDDLIVNQCRVVDGDGTSHEVNDATSQAAYGVRTEQLTVDASPEDSVGIAAARVARYKDPAFRVPTVDVVPGRDAAIWPLVLGRELGDLVTVERTPQGVGALITDTMIVEGIRWNMNDAYDWSVSFNLGLRAYDGGTLFTLDTSSLDGTDVLYY